MTSSANGGNNDLVTEAEGYMWQLKNATKEEDVPEESLAKVEKSLRKKAGAGKRREMK